MKKAAGGWNPSAARPKEIRMNCIRNAVEDALAAIVNPTPEQFGAQEEWQRRHPLAVLAAVTAPTWLLPLLALAGWLS